jgi:putative ABC transport system permease protein
MQGRNPLETKLYRIDDSKTKKTKEFHILGVIQEFNFNSLREVVTPMVLFLAQDQGTLALRVNGSANLHRLTGQIESEWRKMAPSQPF